MPTAYRLVSSLLSVALFVAYFMPIVVKVKDASLVVVVAAGIVLVLLDAWRGFSSHSGS